MIKIRPGARFGIAVPIAGDVRFIPLRNKVWNKVTLHTNTKTKMMTKAIIGSPISINFSNVCRD